ncbi:MAG: methyltransferase [Archaeoglobaceae archaeon]
MNEDLVHFERMAKMVSSVKEFYILITVLDNGIFESFREPKSAEEVANELGLNSRILKKILKALVSMGYLKEANGKFFLSEGSKKYFLSTSPLYQGNLLILNRKTIEERFSKLSNALRNGSPGYWFVPSIFDKKFILAMKEGAVRWDLPKTIEVLSGIPDFWNAKKLLDLGGGHGLYAKEFKRLNTGIEVFIFDLPHVIEIARELVGDGINFIAGDFTKDDIGSGYDIVFASDVFYRAAEDLKKILGKIRESLNSEGLLISKHWHIDDIKNDQTALLFDLMFSIFCEEDRVYSTPEFCEMLKETGFKIEEIFDISSSFSPSKIIIARRLR